MSRFGVILLSICLLDLTMTALGIHFGYLKEASPILNYFLERWGLPGLILSKIFFVATPLLILEIAPGFDSIAQRRIGAYYKFVIYSYVLILEGVFFFRMTTILFL